MGLLDKLKAALGLEESEPSRPWTEPDTESEAAVKGTDEPPVSASDAAGSTSSVTEEPPHGKPEENDAIGAATEPAEAAGPESQVEEPEPADGATEEGALEAADVGVDDAEDATGADETDVEEAEETAETDEVTDQAGTEPDVAEAEEAAGAVPDESDGGGEPLDSLSGIGPAYADRLNDAGVDSIADLAEADAAELSEATGISEKRVQRWIDRAADR